MEHSAGKQPNVWHIFRWVCRRSVRALHIQEILEFEGKIARAGNIRNRGSHSEVCARHNEYMQTCSLSSSRCMIYPIQSEAVDDPNNWYWSLQSSNGLDLRIAGLWHVVFSGVLEYCIVCICKVLSILVDLMGLAFTSVLFPVSGFPSSLGVHHVVCGPVVEWGRTFCLIIRCLQLSSRFNINTSTTAWPEQAATRIRHCSRCSK